MRRTARRRKNAANLEVTAQLVRAVDRSDYTVMALAAIAEMHPANLSRILYGARFGPVVLPKIRNVALSLGLTEEQAVRHVG